MTEIDDLRERVAGLEAEIARLRAREAILSTFHQYLYGLDTGHVQAVVDTYAEDAVLDVINFPPDGRDMHFRGRAEIAELYAAYDKRPTIGGGHNATNVAVAVDAAATSARISAYFCTTRPTGVQGGRYEGTMRLDDDGRWRWTDLAIISAWGWTTDVRQVSDTVDASRSRFGGRPATASLVGQLTRDVAGD